MPEDKDLRIAIQTALSAFEKKMLAEAPLDLLETHTLPLIDTELENLP